MELLPLGDVGIRSSLPLDPVPFCELSRDDQHR